MSKKILGFALFLSITICGFESKGDSDPFLQMHDCMQSGAGPRESCEAFKSPALKNFCITAVEKQRRGDACLAVCERYYFGSPDVKKCKAFMQGGGY